MLRDREKKVVIIGDANRNRRNTKMYKNIRAVICLVLAVLCIFYGIVVRQSGSGTGFFLVWIGIGIVFLLLASYEWFLREHVRIPKKIRRIGMTVLGICAAFFVIIEGCVISQMHVAGKPGLDAIVVLGAQVHASGPSRVLKYRLDKAVEYLQENPDTICIVSGGQGSNEPFPEAKGMADYMEDQGILPERLILETESKTTEENLANSRAYLPDGEQVGIVTNDFHMFRALQIARSQGMEDVCGIAAGSVKLYKINNIVREFFAEVKFLGRNIVEKITGL